MDATLASRPPRGPGAACWRLLAWRLPVPNSQQTWRRTRMQSRCPPWGAQCWSHGQAAVPGVAASAHGSPGRAHSLLLTSTHLARPLPRPSLKPAAMSTKIAGDERITLVIGVVVGWLLNSNQEKIKNGVKKVGNGLKDLGNGVKKAVGFK
jgi:hypothetical protein